jgi:hypothetical protein
VTVAIQKPAGAPIPLPKPTAIGVLKSMALIGAALVTARKRTPNRPTALRLSSREGSSREIAAAAAGVSLRPPLPTRILDPRRAGAECRKGNYIAGRKSSVHEGA